MFLGLRKGLKRMDEFISTSPVEKHLVIRQFHLSQRNLMKQLTGNMATLTVQEHNSQNFTLDKKVYKNEEKSSYFICSNQLR